MKHFLGILCLLLTGTLYAQNTAADQANLTFASSDIIQSSVKAYNEKDISAFVACFAPDAEIFNASGVLLCKGQEKLGEHFNTFFKNHPVARRQVIDRVNTGEKVMEREKLTGLQGGKETTVTSVYELENGLIKAFYFVGEF